MTVLSRDITLLFMDQDSLRHSSPSCVLATMAMEHICLFEGYQGCVYDNGCVLFLLWSLSLAEKIILFCSQPIIRNMDSSDQVRTLWRNADAVCFDVDSTVIMDEAIDEMAKYCGKGDAVAAL